MENSKGLTNFQAPLWWRMKLRDVLAVIMYAFEFILPRRKKWNSCHFGWWDVFTSGVHLSDLITHHQQLRNRLNWTGQKNNKKKYYRLLKTVCFTVCWKKQLDCNVRRNYWHPWKWAQISKCTYCRALILNCGDFVFLWYTRHIFWKTWKVLQKFNYPGTFSGIFPHAIHVPRHHWVNLLKLLLVFDQLFRTCHSHEKVLRHTRFQP